jgi:5'-3' exonuclease
MIPGKHYSWPCYLSEGKHYEVTELGELEPPSKTKGIIGNGLKFFYAQCITGDRTDTIPGLDGHGPVAAYKLLKDCTSEEECFNAVLSAYIAAGKDRAYFIEQANLLWIAREFEGDDKPALYVPVDER